MTNEEIEEVAEWDQTTDCDLADKAISFAKEVLRLGEKLDTINEALEYAEEWKESMEKITLQHKLDQAIHALESIAVAKDCEGYGEVLGGQLMNTARQALKKIQEKQKN